MVATETGTRRRGAVVHAGWFAGAGPPRGDDDHAGAGTAFEVAMGHGGSTTAPVAGAGRGEAASMRGEAPGGVRDPDAADCAAIGVDVGGAAAVGADAIEGAGDDAATAAGSGADRFGRPGPARAVAPAWVDATRGEDHRLAAAIGARLGRARAARGISQERLARLTGVERPTVCRWERGLRLPSIAALLRAAAVLEVPAADLLP